MTRFYAAENPYGRNWVNDGNRPNTLYIFDSKRDRDDWVNADTYHRYPMDYRRASRILKRAHKAYGHTGHGPVNYMDD